MEHDEEIFPITDLAFRVYCLSRNAVEARVHFIRTKASSQASWYWAHARTQTKLKSWRVWLEAIEN